MQTLKVARPKERSSWDWLVVAVFLPQDVRYLIRDQYGLYKSLQHSISWDF